MSTGDVHPQWLVQDVVLAAVDDYAVGEFQLPVARIGGSKTKAIIMEILRVDYYFHIEDDNDNNHASSAFLTTAPSRSEGETCTLVSMAVDMARPLNFANAYEKSLLGTRKELPVSVDTSDGNGNGMLIATDRLVLVYGDVDSTAVSSCSVHIMYRLVEVGIKEYVGIVQSQQG